MIGKTISHYKILAKHGEDAKGVVFKVEEWRLTCSADIMSVVRMTVLRFPPKI